MNSNPNTLVLLLAPIFTFCVMFATSISLVQIVYANENPVENIPLPLYEIPIEDGKILADIKLRFCISKDACQDGGAEMILDAKAGNLETPLLARLMINKSEIGTIEVDLIDSWMGEITFHQLELDETNDHQEILISSHTGGAHCCGVFKILAVYDGKLTFTHFITVDGGPGIRMLNDGSLPFIDNRFLYAFGPYAESYSLNRYYKFEHGKRVEHSKEPQYKDFYLKEMEELKASCGKVNHLPACAAYAAAAARAGKFYEAWNLINTHYKPDPNIEEQYPYFCKKKIRDDEACPENEQIKFTAFPDALLYTLKEWDYVE